MIKNEKANLARLKVSADLIGQALAFPDGAIIHGFRPTGYGMFEITVEHPDLPEVEEGQPIPEVRPILHADNDKRPATWITFDWNLPSLKNE